MGAQPITRDRIVAVARQWVGVPYHHQGRNCYGVDCAGLVVVVARALGIDPSSHDLRGYGLSPDGDRLRTLLTDAAVPVRSARAGDILLLRFALHPQHLAIMTDRGMIHSHARAGKVVEHRINSVWQARIVGAFAFPGVAD